MWHVALPLFLFFILVTVEEERVREFLSRPGYKLRINELNLDFSLFLLFDQPVKGFG